MKTKLLLFGLLLACAPLSYSQQSQQQVTEQNAPAPAFHRVAMGETMVLIAKKYMVTPKDIYELNPDAINGLSAGMRLKIPVDKKVKLAAEEKNLDYELVSAESLKKLPAPVPEKRQAESRNVPVPAVIMAPVAAAEATHEVRQGETLSSLAQKYNTTVKALTEANAAHLKRGLQAGQLLIVPGNTVAEVKERAITAVAAEPENTGSHTVKPGETLTGLAKKYNMTVAVLTAANEKTLRRGLQAGQTLNVAQGNELAEEAPVADVAKETPSPIDTVVPTATGTITHAVQPGETLIGLARKYNTTIDAITESNKSKLKRGLQSGQVLSIVSFAGAEETTQSPETLLTITNEEVVEHKVQPGETLTLLAKKYDTTIEAITEANRQKLRKGLQAGQVISIAHHSNN